MILLGNVPEVGSLQRTEKIIYMYITKLLIKSASNYVKFIICLVRATLGKPLMTKEKPCGDSRETLCYVKIGEKGNIV